VTTPSRRWLLLIVFVSLCLNTIGLRWGLPNGNATWAADALRPLVPMGVVKRAFLDEHWNSGWFMKYPLGHPLVLVSAQAPYVAWLRVSGEFRKPSGTYPFGFRHPERSLAMLEMIARLVSVLMGVGLVLLAYGIASILFGAAAGLGAALLVAGCYPIVFYAHTTNVDVPALFWSAAAVWAALAAAERDSVALAALAGASVGMALCTKEQSLGIVAMVPLVWLIQRGARPVRQAPRTLRQAVAALAGGAAVVAVAGNALWNPSGLFNRWRYLAGVLPEAIRAKYFPYQSMIQVPKVTTLSGEIQHVVKVFGVAAHGVTLPVFAVCALGALWALWRRPRGGAILLVLLLGYYVLSSRALVLVPVRYAMPLMYVLLLLGGGVAGALIEAGAQSGRSTARAAARVAVAVVIGCALLPGIEVDNLLVHDPRYKAETWLRKHLPAAAHIETYQRLTYLPRFGPEVQLTQVPVEERSIARFQARRPDAVVLSSGGRAGLSGRYRRDWKPGSSIMIESGSAAEFLEALRGERLGYVSTARFHTPVHWITPRINSLDPEITIFTRRTDAPS
jgi:hypothetical protein